MILVDCNNAVLASFLYMVKNVLNIIWIVGPMLAIISLTINLTMLVKNPEEKKVPSKIRNSIIALIVLFMIPTIVNVSMALLGNNYEISSCWKSATKPNLKPTYIDPHPGNRQSIISDPNGYDPSVSGGDSSYSGVDTPITSCGNLEYCNRFLTSNYNNSKRLSDAIAKYHPRVEYNYGDSKRTWAEAIKAAESGRLVATTCVVPTNWGLTDVLGKRTVVNSVGYGGFQGYKGKITQYTKQYKFDGSMNVKTAIQKGIIQPGDIIGVKAHTFSIYSVNKSTGSAVVFDGGHRFTNNCNDYKCSTMMTYSAKSNASMRLYQLIRWVK